MGRVTPPVFVEEFAVDTTVAVKHAQAALNSQITVTDDVGPLQRESHQHFGRPDAHAGQARQFGAERVVGQGPQGLHIEFAGKHPVGGRLHIAYFAERQAESL